MYLGRKPPLVGIVDAVDSGRLWRRWFKNPATWAPWRALLKTLFGLPLDEAELQLFRRCTGRTAPPPEGYLEAWLVIGRRGGKSFILALIACFLAAFRNWSPFLSPGERGTIVVIATDRKQARVIFRYCRALLTEVPALAKLVERADDEAIDLANGISIEIMTASFRSVRGYTVVAALCDEIAYWRTEDFAANPDVEILDALRPAQATVPGAMLLCASSPYRKAGALYEAHRDSFGKDDARALIWQAPTLTMHDSPHVRRVVVEAFERDPVSAASEYGRDDKIDFRSDLNTFIDAELVEAAVESGVLVRAPMAGISYFAFCDASSGRVDSFTCAIAHAEGEKVVLDAIIEWKAPFNAAQVVGEVAAFLKTYGLSEVTGDKYAVGFTVSIFAASGITYHENIKVALGDTERALDRSQIYLSALPLFTSGRAVLLDHKRTISQFIALERRSYPSGLDKVKHPDAGHDDCCNAAAGALVLASRLDDGMALMRRLGRDEAPGAEPAVVGSQPSDALPDEGTGDVSAQPSLAVEPPSQDTERAGLSPLQVIEQRQAAERRAAQSQAAQELAAQMNAAARRLQRAEIDAILGTPGKLPIFSGRGGLGPKGAR